MFFYNFSIVFTLLYMFKLTLVIFKLPKQLQNKCVVFLLKGFVFKAINVMVVERQEFQIVQAWALYKNPLYIISIVNKI